MRRVRRVRRRVGLPWQRTRGSALLGFVQNDARWLVERMADQAATSPHPALIP